MTTSVSSSTVTLTLTVEIAAERLAEAVQALFEANPHYKSNLMFYLMRCSDERETLNWAKGPFFKPTLEALEALCPEVVTDFRRREEIKAEAPWHMSLFCSWHECGRWDYKKNIQHPEPLDDGRFRVMQLRFFRTPEGRAAKQQTTKAKEYSYDAMEFSRSYARPQAESARIAAERMKTHKDAAIYRKWAQEAEDIAALIEASAASPTETAELIVTLDDAGNVIKRDYVPVL